MEERASPPPPPPPPHDDTNNTKLHLPDISSGTYVVQVPKDQIYRVPPPQNARIAELHKKPPQKDTKKSRCCCFACIIVFLVIILIIAALLGGLFSIVLTPKDPKFTIQRFHLQSKPHKQYNIFLQSENPNSNLGISYKEGGSVSLSLKKQKNNNNNKNIGSGSYPSFFQPQDNSTVFGVTLKSSTPDFPKEVRDSMVKKKSKVKNKVRVAFSLVVHVEAQTKMMWLLQSSGIKYDVACNATVEGLDKTTARVVSQECETKR